MKNENKKIARLIKQIQRGKQSAFEEFYKLTSSKAYFLALKITQNEHDAEDILQESYIKVLEKINEIDTSQNITSWFMKIVSNKSKDFMKAKGRLVFEDEDETFFEEIPEESAEFSPEESLDQEEIRLEVMAAIDELTEEKRACIMMMYFGDMSVKEIAESIDVPESTVKNRLYTARKDLKSRFEKNGNILYGAALGGIIIWALQKSSLTASAAFLASAASAQIIAGATASYTAGAGATATAAAASTAAASSAASTAAATGTGLAAKIAVATVAQKVAVGIAATAVISGSTAGVVTVVKNTTEEKTTVAYTEEVTTAGRTSKDNILSWLTVPDLTRESSTAGLTERTSRAERTSAPSTTGRATTTQKETTTQKPTTTLPTTTVPSTAQTTEPTTVTTTVPTTLPTTEPTTQAKATVSIDIIDLDGSVIDTINIEVDNGTTLSREFIVTTVQANGYEPMAGVYGNIGAVAQGGNTYSFEAEL